ncbi:MAG: hypothetical protein N2314_05835 [Brevinematales bacterium]|nr:hypothetical protein [Brevinematales bacterium]
MKKVLCCVMGLVLYGVMGGNTLPYEEIPIRIPQYAVLPEVGMVAPLSIRTAVRASLPDLVGMFSLRGGIGWDWSIWDSFGLSSNSQSGGVFYSLQAGWIAYKTSFEKKDIKHEISRRENYASGTTTITYIIIPGKVNYRLHLVFGIESLGFVGLDLSTPRYPVMYLGGNLEYYYDFYQITAEGKIERKHYEDNQLALAFTPDMKYMGIRVIQNIGGGDIFKGFGVRWGAHWLFRVGASDILYTSLFEYNVSFLWSF